MTKLFKFCEAGLNFTFKISGSFDVIGRENIPPNFFIFQKIIFII